MKTIDKILLIVAFSALSQTASAVPFAFEARSLAMGGASVATADLATAAWANPAMLTNQRPEDDFALLTGFGVFVRDNDNLIDDIDDFQDLDNLREEASAAGNTIAEANAIIAMSEVVSGLDGKAISPEVTGAVALGVAFDSFAMALSIRADIIAAGSVTDLSCSPATDATCDLIRMESEITSTDFNILNLEGLLATEFGVSLAKEFQILNRRFSVGIKPKLVDLTSFTYRESALTIDSGLDLITEDENTDDLGTFASIDLGVVFEVSESLTLGLNVRNLITDEFDVDLGIANGTPLQGKLNFDTEARLGIAYRNRFLTVAVDYDLTENQPLLGNPAFEKLKTQYLSVGAEFNAFNFAQLRVGASKNIASDISNDAKDITYSAGVGFWLGFNLDVAATFTDNSVGAFLQTGFRF